MLLLVLQNIVDLESVKELCLKVAPAWKLKNDLCERNLSILPENKRVFAVNICFKIDLKFKKFLFLEQEKGFLYLRIFQ